MEVGDEDQRYTLSVVWDEETGLSAPVFEGQGSCVEPGGFGGAIPEDRMSRKEDKMMRFRWVVIMLVFATFVVAAGPVPGSAQGLEQQTPDGVRGAADLVLGRQSLAESAENPNVQLPKSASESLVIDSAAGAPSWALSLPTGLDEMPVARDASSALFSSSDRTFAAIAEEVNTDKIRGTDARILVVIGGPQAPTRYEFNATLPEGASLIPTPDGGVEVVDGAGEAIGFVEPPWAIDASGAAVDTRFEVRGETLLQIVDHKGAEYPVVADPSVQGDCGWVTCTIRFNRSKTHWIGYSGQSVAGIASSMCALVSGGIGTAACLAAINGIGWVIGSHARNYYNNGNCYGIKFYPFGPAWSHQVTRGTYNCY